MRINTSLLRRHLRTAQLRFSQKTVGLRTKTAVTVCYLADLTGAGAVRRMEKRLENIDIDGAHARKRRGIRDRFPPDSLSVITIHRAPGYLLPGPSERTGRIAGRRGCRWGIWPRSISAFL